jgi:hypothetical protein
VLTAISQSRAWLKAISVATLLLGIPPVMFIVLATNKVDGSSDNASDLVWLSLRL